MLIQKLRLQRGWSQEQLAELSGLSVRTVQRLERGHSASTESLKSIAAVLDVDFSDLRIPEMDIPTDPATPNVTADEALALTHVRNIKRFYFHVARYLVIIAGLAVINLMTDRHQLWFIWVAIIWGGSVAIHGLRVFDKVPFLNGQWERREVEKYLGRRL
jgi:transcriptional regulator with XRE-family HTH domain